METLNTHYRMDTILNEQKIKTRKKMKCKRKMPIVNSKYSIECQNVAQSKKNIDCYWINSHYFTEEDHKKRFCIGLHDFYVNSIELLKNHFKWIGFRTVWQWHGEMRDEFYYHGIFQFQKTFTRFFFSIMRWIWADQNDDGQTNWSSCAIRYRAHIIFANVQVQGLIDCKIRQIFSMYQTNLKSTRLLLLFSNCCNAWHTNKHNINLLWLHQFFNNFHFVIFEQPFSCLNANLTVIWFGSVLCNFRHTFYWYWHLVYRREKKNHSITMSNGSVCILGLFAGYCCSMRCKLWRHKYFLLTLALLIHQFDLRLFSYFRTKRSWQLQCSYVN